MSELPGNRETIRTTILNSKNTRRKSKVIEFFGQKVEIKQPTLGQLNAMAEDERPTIITLLLEYCYVPGTNEKVFEEADQAELMKLPTGDWLLQFNKAIEELTGVDIKEVEKN